MNKLILCEGETDAIFLSYYLGKVSGWEFCKKGPKNLEIRANYDNESVNWYKKGGDYLLICGVGGKDNFGVEKAADFVNRMRTEAGKYICSDRLQLKAHLGVTWAIQSPEKVFRVIDEQIRSVQWEKYEVLKECFGVVAEI